MVLVAVVVGVLHVEFDIPLSLSRGFMSLWSDWCEILSLQQNIKEHISSQPAQFQWKFKQPAFTADSWETKEQFEMVIMFYRFEYSLSFKVAPKVAQYTSVDDKNNFFPTETIVCTYALNCIGAEWRLWVRQKRRWWGRWGRMSHTLMLFLDLWTLLGDTQTEVAILMI